MNGYESGRDDDLVFLGERVERWLNAIPDHLLRAHWAAKVIGKRGFTTVRWRPIPGCPCSTCDPSYVAKGAAQTTITITITELP